MKKKPFKNVEEFTKWFNKIYNKIKATPIVVMVNYVMTFELDFFVMLKERRPKKVGDMQSDEVEIEGNLTTRGKLQRR